MEFHQCKKMFIAYAKSYLIGNELFDRNILLKLAHTQRVCTFAQRIVEEERCFGFDEKTAMYSALFHDVSRFEQFKLYQTYRDSEVFDHGDKGAEILESGIFDLKFLSQNEFDCVADAVKLHNKRSIPENASFALKAVRDADKLDIFAVVLDELDNPSNPDVLYNLSSERRFSNSVAECIENRVSPLHRDLETIDDFVISKLVWIYDLNTVSARRIFKLSDYLERLKKHLPQNSFVDTVFEEANRFLSNN